MPNPSDVKQLWFRSSNFQIEPGEDSETNPGCYGRQLAHWLLDRLREDGAADAGLVAEDWGWCIVVKREPFLLWVGCSNVQDAEPAETEQPPPRGEDQVWTCMVEAEVPLLKRLFRAPDTRPAVEELFARVQRIVSGAPGTRLVDEP